MNLEFILYLAGIFWGVHILRRDLFFAYIWQLKEYRLDRFLEGVKENIGIILPKNALLAAVLLVFYFAFRQTAIIALLLYFLGGAYSLFLFLRNKWRFPRFTVKMVVLLGLILLGEFYLSYLFSGRFVSFILVFEIVFPIFCLAIFGAVQLPVFLLKSILEKKAQRKIEGMANLTVIGITGSYGKSSVKEFLYSILSSKYNCLRTEGNINIKVGIANFILKNLAPEHRFFICEAAAYKRGEVKRICQMVKPKAGILTGINQQHLALFGFLENIKKAKYELIESLPENGFAIFNGDNSDCRELYKKTAIKKIICCSCNPKCDIWADGIKAEKQHISFNLHIANLPPVNLKINVLGSHNVQNILMAIAAAKEFGMSVQEIAEACLKITPEQTGMKFFKKSGLNIIDASYSSNPDGVLAALEYMKVWSQKKVIVMPSLIELGPLSDELHEKIGRKIAEVCDLAIITSNDYFDNIKIGAGKTDRVALITAPEKIIKKINEFCGSGDAVLLEGRIPKEVVNYYVQKI